MWKTAGGIGIGISDLRNAPSMLLFLWRTVTTKGFWHCMSPFWRPSFGFKTQETLRAYLEFRDEQRGRRYSCEIGRWYRPRFRISTTSHKAGSTS